LSWSEPEGASSAIPPELPSESEEVVELPEPDFSTTVVVVDELPQAARMSAERPTSEPPTSFTFFIETPESVARTEPQN
jgi:hypothetical protein